MVTSPSRLAGLAQFYAQDFGWFLFPIKPMAKSPGLVKWATLASNDPKQIAEWWKRWPNANIGLDCGRSDITVLDVDRHKGKNGPESLIILEMLYSPLPKTLRSKTPSDGRHYFFKGKGRNTVSELGSGLDTRAQGGMVLLPPSRLPNGLYDWIP